MTPRSPVMIGAGVAALALLIVATPLQGASRERVIYSKPDSLRQSFRVTSSVVRYGQQPNVAADKASKPIESSYYYDGKLVPLERSGSELSVRFAATTSKSSRSELVGGLSGRTRRTDALSRGAASAGRNR